MWHADTPSSLRRIFVTGIFLAILVAAGAAVIHAVTGRFWLDLGVYRNAGVAVVRGDPLYEFTDFGERGNALAYVYPPFAALLFVPLALVGTNVMIFFWTLLSVLALAVAMWLVLGSREALAGRTVENLRERARLTLIFTLVSLPLYPIFNNLQVGQVNLALLLLVLADLLGALPRRLRGVGVGIAAAVKLTPAIFVVYLLCLGRVRESVRAIAAFAIATAAGFVALPRDSWTYWSGTFADTARVTADLRTINNQSLQGALSRVAGIDADHRVWWLVLAAVVGVTGLVIAVRAHRGGAELTGVVACAVTGLLVSPVSWQNHWVWCIPLLLLVGRRARATLWLLFLLSALWITRTATGHDNEFSGPMLLFSNMYVLIGLCFLVSVAIRRHSASRRVPVPVG